MPAPFRWRRSPQDTDSLAVLSRELRGVCFDVDRHITGHTEEDAARWALVNSRRHAHTVRAILRHARAAGKKGISVLNASGLSCGHQDFSVVDFLRRRSGLDVRWVACESPNSPYLPHERFRRYVESLGIRLEFSDFSGGGLVLGKENGPFDMVIFTEIAEHLSHSTLLRMFRDLRAAMRDDGVLIVTTPNLASAVNRVRLLLGNGDGPYFGDGMENLERGLYGHVVLYDVRRLRRLMHDAGYLIRNAYTFNSYFHGSFRRDPAGWTGAALAGALSCPMRFGGGTVFLLAGKGERVPVPFGI